MTTFVRAASLAFLLSTLAACRGSESESAGKSLSPEQLSKFSTEFASFYERFHADSSFQVEHIAWPLDGNLQQNDAGAMVDVRWQSEDWSMHKPLDLGDSYVQEVDNSQPDLVVERIKTAEGAYLIERRFAKLGDDWWLIYYRVADIG